MYNSPVDYFRECATIGFFSESYAINEGIGSTIIEKIREIFRKIKEFFAKLFGKSKDEVETAKKVTEDIKKTQKTLNDAEAGKPVAASEPETEEPETTNSDETEETDKSYKMHINSKEEEQEEPSANSIRNKKLREERKAQKKLSQKAASKINRSTVSYLVADYSKMESLLNKIMAEAKEQSKIYLEKARKLSQGEDIADDVDNEYNHDIVNKLLGVKIEKSESKSYRQSMRERLNEIMAVKRHTSAAKDFLSNASSTGDSIVSIKWAIASSFYHKVQNEMADTENKINNIAGKLPEDDTKISASLYKLALKVNDTYIALNRIVEETNWIMSDITMDHKKVNEKINKAMVALANNPDAEVKLEGFTLYTGKLNSFRENNKFLESVQFV